ncbi:MAG: lipid-A-disaccharide synthase [Pseudomonadota bacterium]|nr:lipid-A-disaccharide synthase [Pseudomonadota bacterium]
MKRILVSAQEASGDRLGAELILAMRARADGEQLEVSGLVGPLLLKAGAVPLPDSLPMNPVMGLVEVLKHLGELRHNTVAMARAIDARPDVLVVIDAPDFNLPLARAAKAKGVPVVGLVSPQLWAWRSGRAQDIARSLDLLLCLFPFEPAYYTPHGLDARWIGHPAIDRVRPSAREPGVVALFPGSRRSEIKRLLNPFLAAVAGLGAREVLLPLAASLSAADLGPLPANVRLCTSEEALSRADRALTKSGTSTLEIALAGIPMVVAHRVHPLTYWIGRLLVRGVQHLSLPNILLGREAVREHVQYFTPEQLTADLRAAAPPPTEELAALLGAPGVADRAAAAVLALVGIPPGDAPRSPLSGSPSSG